jgi:hypothetical protein
MRQAGVKWTKQTRFWIQMRTFCINYSWGYKLIQRAKRGRLLIFISYLIMETKQNSEPLRLKKKKKKEKSRGDVKHQIYV